MKKEDYIKLLRELQNDLKNEIIENEKFFKNCNYEEYQNDLFISESEYLLKSLIGYIFFYLTYLKDYRLLSIIMGSLGSINLVKSIMIYLADKELYENLIFIRDMDLKLKEEIVRLENGISLFQNSSEEEIQKYLSYKMGDDIKNN